MSGGPWGRRGAVGGGARRTPGPHILGVLCWPRAAQSPALGSRDVAHLPCRLRGWKPGPPRGPACVHCCFPESWESW